MTQTTWVRVLTVAGLWVGLHAQSAPVQLTKTRDATALLEACRSSSAAQSPSLYELYSDRAHIHINNRESPLTPVFDGAVYKASSRRLLSLSQLRLEATEFHEPSVEKRAERTAFHAIGAIGIMTTESPSSGSRVFSQIMEEWLTIDPTARCAPMTNISDALPRSPSAIAALVFADWSP